ncbi:MAG TPA: hypothetical protein VM689_26300 [Aliidongia sp.]|nr:hypothetical protein [Aliidongia sp.]
MNSSPQTAAIAHDDQADPIGARAESCAGTASLDPAAREALVLDELTEIGMTIARALKDEALARAAIAQAAAARVAAGEEAEPPAAAGIDLSLSFARVSRAVRLCLAVKLKLASDRLALAEQRRVPAIEAAKTRRRKRQVTEAVERLVEAEAAEAGRERDTESLYADMRERLDDAGTEAELLGNGVGHVLKRICRDLGITQNWRLWQDTSWFQEERWTIAAPAKEQEDEEAEDEPAEDEEPAAPEPETVAAEEVADDEEWEPSWAEGLRARFGIRPRALDDS